MRRPTASSHGGESHRWREGTAGRRSQHHVPTPIVVRLRDDPTHAESTLNPFVLPNIRHEEVFRARREARQISRDEVGPPDGRTSQKSRERRRAHHQITMLRFRAEFPVVGTPRESEPVGKCRVDDVCGRGPVWISSPAGRRRAPPVHEVVVLRLFDFELVAFSIKLFGEVDVRPRVPRVFNIRHVVDLEGHLRVPVGLRERAFVRVAIV